MLPLEPILRLNSGIWNSTNFLLYLHKVTHHRCTCKSTHKRFFHTGTRTHTHSHTHIQHGTAPQLLATLRVAAIH